MCTERRTFVGAVTRTLAGGVSSLPDVHKQMLILGGLVTSIAPVLK